MIILITIYRMGIRVKLFRSKRKGKKWVVQLLDQKKNVHFGARGYSDFTIHKDGKRRANYLARHAPREDWTISGINTAGFWSRHLLWGKSTIESAKRTISINFNVKFV